MDNKMTFRVLIFDDDEIIRKILWEFFDDRGYEVFTFPHPRSCDLVDIKTCTCPVSFACADMILTDLNMPFMPGLDFLENQIKKGCKVRHMALMTGDNDKKVSDHARSLGIKFFSKPFSIQEIEEWVEMAEKDIPEGRSLYNWNTV